MRKTALTLATLGLLALSAPALASDHLADATAATRDAPADFGQRSNPVADNPSGVSGAASEPGTVPGEGNPGSGGDDDTPAVDRGLVDARKGRGAGD